MDFLNEMWESFANAWLLFWGNYKPLMILFLVILGLLLIWLIIGIILRKRTKKKIEKELQLQRDLIIRAEEDINKLYTDLNAFSNHIVAFNNMLANQSKGTGESSTPVSSGVQKKEKTDNLHEGYRTVEGQQSVKSQSGKEYTVDQLVNTIVE